MMRNSVQNTPAYQAMRWMIQRLWLKVTGTQFNARLFAPLIQALVVADEEGSMALSMTNQSFGIDWEQLFANDTERTFFVRATENLDPAVENTIFYVHEAMQLLYWSKNWHREGELALAIATYRQQKKHKISQTEESYLQRRLEKALAQNEQENLESDTLREYNEGNRQQFEAIRRSLQERFSIITGGPGTGKTTTVVQLLLALRKENPHLTIGLAAPTGKATSRMLQSIHLSKDGQSLAISAQHAKTIHRWLHEVEAGDVPGEQGYLPLDVFVLDRASMMDARIANRLFRVLDPCKTKVILLGDPQQLAAVGPGAVFADMIACDQVSDVHTSELKVSRRFHKNSAVGQLAKALIDSQGSLENVKEKCRRFSQQLSISTQMPRGNNRVSKDLKDWLQAHLQAYWKDIIKIGRAKNTREQTLALKKAWNTLNGVRVLAAAREGKMSVDAINRYCHELLIAKTKPTDPQSRFQTGDVIMVRKNDNRLGLSNGDIGILFYEQDHMEVYFGDMDRAHQKMPLSMISQFEMAFAMTIHKSQGSEFDTVAIVMHPDHRQLASQELLYTGVTRARECVALFMKEESIHKSLQNRVHRASGLTYRIQSFERALRQNA